MIKLNKWKILLVPLINIIIIIISLIFCCVFQATYLNSFKYTTIPETVTMGNMCWDIDDFFHVNPGMRIVPLLSSTSMILLLTRRASLSNTWGAVPLDFDLSFWSKIPDILTLLYPLSREYMKYNPWYDPA